MGNPRTGSEQTTSRWILWQSCCYATAGVASFVQVGCRFHKKTYMLLMYIGSSLRQDDSNSQLYLFFLAKVISIESGAWPRRRGWIPCVRGNEDIRRSTTTKHHDDEDEQEEDDVDE